MFMRQRHAVRRRAPAVRPSWPGLVLGLLGVCTALPASAWSLAVAAASSRVFLHVGTGSANANNGTIDQVTANLTPAELLARNPKVMTNSGLQSNSLSGDNYATCPTPSTQVLIGASYRRNGNSQGQAVLNVSAPASLVSAAGDTIPINEISWTVSAPGSSVPGIIPAGTFSGGQQRLASVPPNTFIENCHTFRYANSAIRAAGTYTGVVTYTLSTP